MGALLSSAGIFASTFSTNILMLTFYFGIIGGLGQGLMFVPAGISAGFLFDKRRALATG